MTLHSHRGFPYLFFSCPSVPAALQRHLEAEPSLKGGRYPAGCKASACQELESASQSGTAAPLCKKENALLPSFKSCQASCHFQNILCCWNKVVELSSSLLQSFKRSGLSGGLQTNHHALGSEQTVTIYLEHAAFSSQVSNLALKPNYWPVIYVMAVKKLKYSLKPNSQIWVVK